MRIVMTSGLILLLFTACSISKKKIGLYYNPWRYWSATFILKSDSTFIYREPVSFDTLIISKDPKTRITTSSVDKYEFKDTSHGMYSLKGDTVSLHYLDDTLQAPYYIHNRRPQKLSWQGKRLYYFFYGTGEVFKLKEHYLK